MATILLGREALRNPALAKVASGALEAHGLVASLEALPWVPLTLRLRLTCSLIFDLYRGEDGSFRMVEKSSCCAHHLTWRNDGWGCDCSSPPVPGYVNYALPPEDLFIAQAPVLGEALAQRLALAGIPKIEAAFGARDLTLLALSLWPHLG